MVAKEGVWPRLFCQFFMGVVAEDNGTDGGDLTENGMSHQTDDDMLFYVQNKPNSPDQEVRF